MIPKSSTEKISIPYFWLKILFVFCCVEAQRTPSYPQMTSIPKTSFTCTGRGAGYYADATTHCQVYHMCDLHEKQYSYLCPNQTLFNQKFLVCDHWYMVDCKVPQGLFTQKESIGTVAPSEKSDEITSNNQQNKLEPKPTITQHTPTNQSPQPIKQLKSTQRPRVTTTIRSTTAQVSTTTQQPTTSTEQATNPTTKPSSFSNSSPVKLSARGQNARVIFGDTENFPIRQQLNGINWRPLVVRPAGSNVFSATPLAEVRDSDEDDSEKTPLFIPLHLVPDTFLTPPNSSLTPLDTFLTPPNSLLTPPDTFSSPPNSLLTPLDTFLTPPNSLLTPPDTFLTPPNSLLTPPDTFLTPPNSLLTKPDTFLTPPENLFIPPNSLLTPPTTLLTPPFISPDDVTHTRTNLIIRQRQEFPTSLSMKPKEGNGIKLPITNSALPSPFFIPASNDQQAHTSTPGHAHTSQLNDISHKSSMTMTFPEINTNGDKLTRNPACPKCHPAFLQPGKCTPCVVIK